MTKEIKNNYNLKHKAIKYLLENGKNSLEDKLTTVKTARLVDKNRFQSAFNSLLKK